MPTTDELERQKQMAEMMRQRKMQEDFGDIEFQMDLAPNLNYQGPIDPKLYRLRQTDLDEPTETRGYRVSSVDEIVKDRGMTPEEADAYIRSGELRTKYIGMGARPRLPVEPGTINAVNARNSTIPVLSHEYRHQQGLDARNERLNRKIDAWNAQNQSQWDDAVEMERWYQGGDGKTQAPRDETEKKMIEALNNMAVPEKYQDMLVPNPWFKRRKR